jgi:integrase
MSTLQKALKDYLALRRALGFELRKVGHHLQDFVGFLEREGASHITTPLALRWATQPSRAQPCWWAGRLSMVRRFAQYVSAADPGTEVPPQGLLPHRYHRKPPYLYSEAHIKQLLQAASQLPSPTGLRPRTYATLLGLLAVTGMRISEPLALERDDVDLTQGVLTIRRTKFGKSRLVTVHPSTQCVLSQYAHLRDHVCRMPRHPNFFISERGTALTQWAVRWTFVRLSRQIGLRGPADRHGPRLHDFRHRFAVCTLLNWYRAGVDVEQRLPELSTYLGHVHVTDTYWYLTATPELLRLATERLERADVGCSS